MKLFEVLVMIIILVATILIGTPIKYNCVEFSLAIVLIGIIFIIYMLFKKKKIIEDKLDIAVLVLCLSPIIPLIFKSYISLNDTLEYLLKYLSCFSIYIMVKQIVKNNPKALKRIINILIISSLILIVIGIDFMTTQILVQPLEKLGIPYMENLGRVMSSSLGTTNSFAIILAISIMLILYQISKEKKAIYFLALLLNFIALLLTNSRAVWLIFGVFLIAYLIMQKDKNKSVYMLYTMVPIAIISIIYIFLWNKIRHNNAFFLMWIINLIICIISYFIYKLFNKFYDRISKISRKKIIIITIAFVIGTISLFVIGTQLTMPLTIFEEGKSNNDIKYEIKNIKPNTEYSFKFDIEAKSKSDEIENYSIAITEENKYYDEIKTHYITFNNYTGIKEAKIITSADTVKITMKFERQYQEFQAGVRIKKCTINDKIYPLKYVYLPNRLVKKIEDINFSDKSVWERLTYYKDAFEIIKMHPFIGQGANSWHYLYQDVQSYRYEATEVHSYPIQILMDYGIVPLIAFVAIILIILTKNRSFYTFVFLLLIAHSIIDFDMSFFYIMILAFILLAIISSKQGDKKEEINIANKVIAIVLILVLLFWSGFETIYLNRQKLDITQALELVDNNRGNELINYIKNEQKLEKYIFNSYYLEDLNYSNVSYENLQYMYDNITNQKLTLDIDANMKRNKLISKIIITTTNEEMKNKFIDIILNENEKNIELIKNKEKNRLTDNMISIFLSIQDSTYKSIQKIKK